MATGPGLNGDDGVKRGRNSLIGTVTVVTLAI